MQWKTVERHYTLTDTTFTKRQLREDELVYSVITKKPIRARYDRERLQNEAAALQYITSNTSIPVPKFRRLYNQDGVLHLELNRVPGVELLELFEDGIPAAIQKSIERTMNTVILPQLRNLRRNSIGSVNTDLPVFPPSRIYDSNKREEWPQKVSDSSEFVFCHNDLSRQNIMVDPETLEITAIIDWEFSGFFPFQLELPFWKFSRRGAHELCYKHNDEDIKLLLASEEGDKDIYSVSTLAPNVNLNQANKFRF